MSRDVLAAEGARSLEAARFSEVALPLSLRIPNPPVGFTGRGSELRRLRACLEAAPATVILGPAGVGKTALALAALHAPGAPRRPQAFLQVAALAPATLLLRLRKVLSLGERTPPDWGLLASNPAESLAALIDLADAGGWCLLLDDADRAEPAELDWLLEGVARYARQSRWVLTARSLAPGRAAGAARISLGPMAEGPLRRLAAAVAPARSADERDQAVAAAAGSPRALLRRLSEAGQAPLPAAHAAQALLGCFQRPLSLATLASLGLRPQDPGVQALEARGALLRLPEGLLLRPSEEPAAAPEPAALRALAARLEALPGEDAQLEALRLWLAAEEAEQAAALLDAQGHDLCERGFAPDIWLLLDRAPAALQGAPPLLEWKAWCAFEWSDARVLEARPAAQPARWLSAQLEARKALRSGQLAAAEAHADRAVALAPSALDRDRARIHKARAAFSAGGLERALEICDQCEAPQGAVGVEIQMIRAEVAALRGAPERAARLIAALLGDLEALAPAVRLRAYLGGARVHLIRQRLRDAERVVEAILAVRAERAADAVSGRTAIELAAAVAAQRGRFDWLRSLAERLQPGHRVAPVRFLFVRSFLAAADEWQTTPQAFEASVQALRVDCDADGGSMARDVRAYVDLLLTRIAMQRGLPPERLGPPQPAEVATRMLAAGRDIVRALHKARFGQPHGLPDPEGPAAAGGAEEHRVLWGLAQAIEALVAGAPGRAEDALQRALDRTQAAGYTLHLLEVLRLQVWSALALGDEALRARRVAALQALAAQIGGPRLAEEAEFFAACAKGPPPPAQLEAWAADEESAAPRQRWARWWLGEAAPLDRLEAGIFETCVARDGWRRAARLAGDGSVGLGLDVLRQQIWGPGLVVTDLARHGVLLGLVEALLAHGGAASKEALVLAVWGVASYHPLQHDNRLRVAVRKLRARLGPEREGLLETLEDGYALRGTWRRLA